MPLTAIKVRVCRELKVATGEWFLEERSKRFEQGVPSTDVIKQTILSSPASESVRHLVAKFSPGQH